MTLSPAESRARCHFCTVTSLGSLPRNSKFFTVCVTVPNFAARSSRRVVEGAFARPPAQEHIRSTTNRLEAYHASLSHDALGCWQTSTNCGPAAQREILSLGLVVRTRKSRSAVDQALCLPRNAPP